MLNINLPKIALTWGNVGGDSQQYCPLQSKLWRGHSLPVPP